MVFCDISTFYCSTTNVRHHDRCEWLNITMLVSLCSSNIFVDHRSYSLIGYFLTTRFREGVPLKHLKKISTNTGRCNQHCSDWMVCWSKIIHRQRCSRLVFWYILMNCRPFQRKSFGTWYLYSKKVLGKFCQHFPCKLKPIPLDKKSRAPNDHPVHALLSRNVNGLKHPKTYQSQVDEKPSPPATCIEICLDMGIETIAPSPRAEPTFILDYGPQFCGFEMVIWMVVVATRRRLSCVGI